MERKKYILIIYDITDNRRRNRLVKVLAQYGVRIQKSAFEGHLNEDRYMELIDKCKLIIDTSEDSICFYILDKFSSICNFGVSKINFDDDECVIF